MHQKTLRGILVAALCGLFLALAMGAALLAGGVYRSVNTAAEAHFTQRTALLYLTNHVKSARETGCAVELGALENVPALLIREPSGTYATAIYAYEGQMWELFYDTALALGPDAGNQLFPLAELSMEETGGLISFSVTDFGGTTYTAEVSAP